VTGTARRAAVVVAALAGVLAVAAPASAHPLGNFTVNTASAVVVEPDAVRVDVVVDRAEIPTRQRFPDLDDRSGELPGGSAGPARELCDEVLAAAALSVDGRSAALAVTTRELDFPPGAAGLRTARLTCGLRTEQALPDLVGSTVEFALDPVSPAAGWRETTASGDGVRLEAADVPVESTTGYLRAYPEEQLASPLDVTTASLQVGSGTGLATGVGGVLGGEKPSVLPRGADRITEAFTDLVSREQLTVSFGLLAVGVSLLLGALHAFAPGHGKTVMAAYLVGGRGSLRDALVIGASVTVTHTLGVLILGAVLTAVGLASPERAYPILGTASGVLLIGIGVVLLRAARGRRPTPLLAPQPERALVPAGAPTPQHEHDHPHHDHPHDHDHQHEHTPAGGEHSHGLFSHTHALPEKGSGIKGLLVVGLAGGMVPSPSALVVLLGGIALGRAWFGFGLVVAYGLGMALALMATGLLLVRARDRVEAVAARASHSRGARLATRAASVLPTATAVVVVLVGAGVLLRAVVLL
jgi:ABC-type nickel/cobalt efflux system permease component RcnA